MRFSPVYLPPLQSTIQYCRQTYPNNQSQQEEFRIHMVYSDRYNLDNSQSYLGVDGGGGMGMGSVLRDTAISGYENDDSNRARFLASHRFVGVIRCLVVCCLHFSPHRRTNECKTDQSASIILCYFISTMCFHQLNRFHIFDKSWLGLELNY